MKLNKKSFSLTEILIILGVVAILFVIALIAVNPTRQFAQSNNNKRNTDSTTLLKAISRYMEDNKGILPLGITTIPQNISNSGANLCADLVPKYLTSLPRDPSLAGGDITSCNGAYDTGYQVVQGAADNRITVSAPLAELGKTISITK